MKCSSLAINLVSTVIVSSLLVGCGVDSRSASATKTEEAPTTASYREINIESFKFELNDLADDQNSFWVNSMFQTNNLGTDACFLEKAKDTRFAADANKVELKGSWDFISCLNAMEEEGQKNEWEIAALNFDVEVNCEGLDHSAFNQVLITEGTKMLRDQCKDAPSVSLKQKITSRTKGKITVSYSGTEFVNAMDFESTASFGTAEGQTCKTVRTGTEQYKIDGCRNFETEVNVSQVTYKMANGEVKVEPTKTEMELTQQDYLNVIARPVFEGTPGEEEAKGLPISGKIDFIRNNWTGSITFAEGSKPAYQANGVIAGENKAIEGTIE